MSDETKVETTEAPAGMAALGALSQGNAHEGAAAAAPAEPKIDNLGRSYATGRRKAAAGVRVGVATCGVAEVERLRWEHDRVLLGGSYAWWF